MNRICYTVTLMGLLFFALTCENGSDRQATYRGPALDTLGLVQRHCGDCHQLPKPEQLDRATWQDYVLPRMGYRLGIYPRLGLRDTLLAAEYDPRQLAHINVYPATAQLSLQEWNAIKQYYIALAPDSLPRPALTITVDSTRFRPLFPAHFFSPPSAASVRFLSGGGYLVGDINKATLMRYDGTHQLRQVLRSGVAIVQAQPSDEGIYATHIGSFSPSDQPLGYVALIPANGEARTLVGGLQRPVDCGVADFNGDGRKDLAIAEFGKLTGQLAWWEQRPDQSYVERTLRPLPGTVRAIPLDADQDGDQDILALFGQGDEGIWLYQNDGKGQFNPLLIQKFPPSYGSTFLDTVDWNGDGKFDLIYTAGDNTDFPPVVKSYQGIRILLNQGQGVFTEAEFFPLPGAYKAIVRDFDLDGDLDIAAISFFPDYARQPEQRFVLIEQGRSGQWQYRTFPAYRSGRWISMDAADADGDGDTDLLLGSFALEVVPDRGEVAEWVKNGLLYCYLENRTR